MTGKTPPPVNVTLPSLGSARLYQDLFDNNQVKDLAEKRRVALDELERATDSLIARIEMTLADRGVRTGGYVVRTTDNALFKIIEVNVLQDQDTIEMYYILTVRRVICFSADRREVSLGKFDRLHGRDPWRLAIESDIRKAPVTDRTTRPNRGHER